MAQIQAFEDANPQHRTGYTWRSASLNVLGTAATTDITGETGFGTLFDPFPAKRAHKVKLSVASGTGYFRLNSSTSDVITVTATIPYESYNVAVHKIFASTNGSAITVTVQLN